METSINALLSKDFSTENHKVIENHKIAAAHLEAAARHHKEAAKHFESGNDKKAFHSIFLADVHFKLASKTQHDNTYHSAINNVL